MRTDPAANSELRAAKRRIEIDLVMLASDRSKHARLFATLQADQRKLKMTEKQVSLDLLRTAAELRKEETELRRIDADIVYRKKKLNTLR
ncbi:MAG: hypothetical protein KA731_02595 [Candidatus Moranbacteria bacterium]|nr:hypothetical protein [Candidatus Moranbacteria bacterium]MBP6034165.1 hypothetical protein [Candidatus Moranbacteria bacterium]MBP7695734.1 hypothetical protein [Candidatus Moranbacteria bacterium]